LLKTFTLVALLFCIVIWHYTIQQFAKRLPERNQKYVHWTLAAIDMGVLILLSFLLAAVLLHYFQWEFRGARYVSALCIFILLGVLNHQGYLPFRYLPQKK